jgi:peptidyl-prolyl cis-trans isomerase A (cyclophilin A)
MVMAFALLALAQAAPASAATGSPSAPAEWTAGPVVVLETTLGSIKIGLDKEKAPLSVDNFMKYLRAGTYNGTIFHRVIPDFMIQGGGMDKNMVEKTMRPPIRNEARNGLRNVRGSIAMARTGAPNSATAQFFINVKDNPLLDYGVRGAGYAVFGKVLEGMEVADKISAVPTTTREVHKVPYENVPITAVVITSAKEVGGAAGAAKPSAPKPTPTPTP